MKEIDLAWLYSISVVMPEKTLSPFVKKMVMLKGLAQLLSECPRLKLVILNGCSTIGWVKLLHRYNIPVVIGTYAEISDENAALFSKMFYTNWVRGNNLKQAFSYALKYVCSLDPNIRSISLEVSQGLKPRLDDRPAWGIFINKKRSNLEEFRLASSKGLPIEFEKKRYLVNREDQDNAILLQYQKKPR